MLQGQTYVPFMFTKGAELKALFRLEPFTRNNIFPILSIRPGSHNQLSDTLDYIRECVGNLRFALDLDRDKIGKSKRSPAKEQFDALFDSTDGYKNYYDLVESWLNAIPVLRSNLGKFDHLDQQISHIAALDRGVIVKIDRDYTTNLNDIVESGLFTNIDKMFVIDAGWSEDVLQAENWAHQKISAIETAFPESEIACLSSSYPRDFSNVKGRGIFSNDDRELFDRLRRRHNQAKLTYGDWASTRSSVERIANKPRPRLDIPTTREWIVFRLADKEEGGFLSVAKRVKNDRVWLETPDCWGKRLIDLTCLKLPQQIDTDHKAHVARIHLHVTIQAMGGTVVDIPDEPYVDPF